MRAAAPVDHLQEVGVAEGGLRGAAPRGVVRQQLRQQVHCSAARRQGVAMCACAHMLQAHHTPVENRVLWLALDSTASC